jgi:hypothetical protein
MAHIRMTVRLSTPLSLKAFWRYEETSNAELVYGSASNITVHVVAKHSHLDEDQPEKT